MIDFQGHIKIADFGLSKDNNTLQSRSYSFCGSPEYMAPEMLTQKGHSFTIDYYSLGALLYEMIIGLPPFYSKNRDQMYYQILHANLPLNANMSHELQQLLVGLLNKNPHDRLGAKHGASEIKKQSWCAGINWDQYLSRSVKPPFCISMHESNFDSEYMLNAVRNRDPEEHSCSYFDSAFQSQDIVENSICKVNEASEEMANKNITSKEVQSPTKNKSSIVKLKMSDKYIKENSIKKILSKKSVLLSNIHNILPNKIKSELGVSMTHQ